MPKRTGGSAVFDLRGLGEGWEGEGFEFVLQQLFGDQLPGVPGAVKTRGRASTGSVRPARRE